MRVALATLNDERRADVRGLRRLREAVISDWIVDAPPEGMAGNGGEQAKAGNPNVPVGQPNVNRFRRSGPARPIGASDATCLGPAESVGVGQLIRRHLADLSAADRADDDVRSVAERLADVDDAAVAIERCTSSFRPESLSPVDCLQPHLLGLTT